MSAKPMWHTRYLPTLVEAALLGGLGAMFLLMAWQGTLAYYIHPRYVPLVVAGALVLLPIAGVRAASSGRAWPSPAGRRWPGYALLALPLLLGLFVPARPLGADDLSATVTENTRATQGGIALADDPGGWNLLQWGTALATKRPGLAGQAVDVVGFVYHNPARPLDGFVVARYSIVCCIADVKGIGLPVDWPGGATLAADGWVRVRGTLGEATVGGQRSVAIVATTVEIVPQPTEPYLYR